MKVVVDVDKVCGDGDKRDQSKRPKFTEDQMDQMWHGTLGCHGTSRLWAILETRTTGRPDLQFLLQPPSLYPVSFFSTSHTLPLWKSIETQSDRMPWLSCRWCGARWGVKVTPRRNRSSDLPCAWRLKKKPSTTRSQSSTCSDSTFSSSRSSSWRIFRSAWKVQNHRGNNIK